MRRGPAIAFSILLACFLFGDARAGSLDRGQRPGADGVVSPRAVEPVSPPIETVAFDPPIADEPAVPATPAPSAVPHLISTAMDVRVHPALDRTLRTPTVEGWPAPAPGRHAAEVLYPIPRPVTTLPPHVRSGGLALAREDTIPPGAWILISLLAIGGLCFLGRAAVRNRSRRWVVSRKVLPTRTDSPARDDGRSRTPRPSSPSSRRA